MARKGKRKGTRVAIGLTIPYSGWTPAKSTNRRRRRESHESGYSERERDIIGPAPLKFTPWKWRAVRRHRRETVEIHCKLSGIPIPEKEEWKFYFANLRRRDVPKSQRIEDWDKATERVDAQFGHLTIFDIFYEAVEEILD